MSFADFDRYCAERGITPAEAPEAFAQWLADQTGQAVVGGPAGEAPTIVAIPDDESPDT